MAFTAPVAEQLFVLKHITGIDALAGHNRFADATPDMVQAIVEGIGEFAAGEFAPLNRIGDTVGARLVDGKVVMPEGFVPAYKAYVDNGWGSINAPADFGGQGLPFSLATVALDSLGAANMAFALCPILSVGAIEAINHHGSDAQKATFLPKLSTGEWTGTMNLTEPQAGSDVGALRSTATPRGDGTYQIKGTKIYISFGDHDMAENIVHLVLARTPDAPAGTKGISLFLVPKYQVAGDGSLGKANDIKVVSIEHKMGINASPTCVLAFGEEGDCVGELIGPEFGGMRAMFTMMNNARLNVGLQGVQIAEGATQKAIWFASERVQSAKAGGPSRDPVAIIEHPDVRRMLMRMKAGTQAIRALLYYASGYVDRAATGRSRRARNGRFADSACQNIRHRHGQRNRLARHSGARRHGLHRGNRRRAILSRYPHRRDIRRHQRHSGGRPCRAQARHGGRRSHPAAFAGDSGRCDRSGGPCCAHRRVQRSHRIYVGSQRR